MRTTIARALRSVADRLEPPAELLDRGRVERAASRARHPSVTTVAEYDLPGVPRALAPVVPLRPQEGDQ